ncbi:hypothetical protein BDZ89DRAFT_325214 [Hymenopellis radicata]|nr:hypothetical protein BDZ89DRAFT_325214 [Hymenopellis radicata]
MLSTNSKLFAAVIGVALLPAVLSLQVHCADTRAVNIYVPLAQEAGNLLCAERFCAPEVGIPEDPTRSKTVCSTDVSEATATVRLGTCTDNCEEATSLIIAECIENGWTSGYATTEDESEYYYISDKATTATTC